MSTKTKEELRTLIKKMGGLGIKKKELAFYAGLSEKKFEEDSIAAEAKRELIERTATVAQSLYKMATDPKKPNTVAALFWLKVNADWIEAEKQTQQEVPQTFGKIIIETINNNNKDEVVTGVVDDDADRLQ
jgi:hypothetical protein